MQGVRRTWVRMLEVCGPRTMSSVDWLCTWRGGRRYAKCSEVLLILFVHVEMRWCELPRTIVVVGPTDDKVHVELAREATATVWVSARASGSSRATHIFVTGSPTDEQQRVVRKVR